MLCVGHDTIYSICYLCSAVGRWCISVYLITPTNKHLTDQENACLPTVTGLQTQFGKDEVNLAQI